jgi:hypothetical protein
MGWWSNKKEIDKLEKEIITIRRFKYENIGYYCIYFSLQHCIFSE